LCCAGEKKDNRSNFLSPHAADASGGPVHGAISLMHFESFHDLFLILLVLNFYLLSLMNSD